MRAGEEVVDTRHVVPLGDQAIAEVRAEKPSSSGLQEQFADRACPFTPYSAEKKIATALRVNRLTQAVFRKIVVASSIETLPLCLTATAL